MNVEEVEDEIVIYDASGDVYVAPPQLAAKTGAGVWSPLIAVVFAPALAGLIVLGAWLAKPHAHDVARSGTTTAFTIETSPSATPKAWTERKEFPAPKGGPPRDIAIGQHVYRVHYTNSNALASVHSFAMTDTDTREIWLDIERRAERKDDMLHELMHCSSKEEPEGTWSYGVYWGDGEESAIKRITPAFLPMLKNNPALLKWLLEG